MAEMMWLPQPSSAPKRATPAPSRATVPSTVVPSRKVTVPAGGTGASLWTIAWRVTAAPKGAEAAEEITVVVVEARPTAWRRVTALGAKLASPEYSARTSCSPTARSAIVICACPARSRGIVPRSPSPARNVTLPVGTLAALDWIVTVNVTGRPTVAGVASEATISDGGDIASGSSPPEGACPLAVSDGSVEPALRRSSGLHSGSVSASFGASASPADVGGRGRPGPAPARGTDATPGKATGRPR